MTESMPLTELQNGDRRFLDETTAIDQDITTIRSNIERISQIQNQMLRSTSNAQETEYNEEIEPLTVNTKTLLIQVKDKIKNIERENLRLSPQSKYGPLREKQHKRLQEKFTNALREYQTVEQSYMQSQKEKITRQYRIVNPNATQEEIDNYVSNPSSQPVFQQALLRSGEARAAAAEVQKRHDDIKQIEQTISEILDLTTEMALIVDAQDEVIVDIGENIDNANNKLQNGNNQITQAQKLALAARRRKWIIFIILLLIIAGAVAAVLVVFLRK
ncbi:hypothetical protein G9A89_001040 [Geosiphon pyriformis]|nr:hypothetical protein G9A89_001040 [Geosiphon pyriformis]